ncbi:3-phenylpropionate/cinnamic acid dioxygenase, small subunit [Thermomonospora echinospora]|uniref:3-phenylpropionate/cinnamic acid dioxygenase, small subunit n=1 Tax=Thermomonospora echinospora TaxID=1992 RepID=A0A1H6E2K1_9ACTN|nr:aromatic-ring-hydroxylating dioxygenase subunit beta [Thermomonospora echinospora]SEG91938.1 3-phenylpropionate/cinnamic acid dioxygenase, small subunit [Thermomonospora echinospora]
MTTATQRPTPAPPQVQAEAALFLAVEAELIDDRRYAEWLDVVTDDFTYTVPVPVTPDNPFAPHHDPEALLLDESKDSIRHLWFRRLEADMHEFAWGENPPPQLRHFVTNVRAYLTGDPDELAVRSNVLVVGRRQSDQPKYLSAERFDTLRRGAAGLLLARRHAVLDQTVIDFPQPRVLL